MKKLLVALVFFCSYSLFAKDLKILFIGDSLTEGYGVQKELSYPSLIKKEFKKLGFKNIEILNGSISGSTTASALSRLKWFKKVNPSIVVLALGANDGLRGIKVQESQKNLAKAIEFAAKVKMRVILTGMMVPPNYGPSYGKRFQNMYKILAKEHQIELIPFLLKGVAGEKELNQSDGIHPNEKGHKVMMKNVMGSLLKLVKKVRDNA